MNERDEDRAAAEFVARHFPETTRFLAEERAAASKPLPFEPVRSIVLDTLDYGPVTVDCPAWCIGHAWQDGAGIGRNDICHRSVRVKSGRVTESRGWLPMLTVWVSWAPFAELVPVISLVLDAEGDYPAEDGQHIAEGLRVAATRIERLAAEVLRLRGDVR